MENLKKDTFKEYFVFVLKQIDDILKKKDSIKLYNKFLLLILNELISYRNIEISKLDLSKRVFNDSIHQKFDILITHIDTFYNFLQQISKKDQIETILTSSFLQDITLIEEFRKNFNHYIIDLKLFINYCLPLRICPLKETVYKLNAIFPYREIINSALSKQNKYSEDQINTLNKRLNEIKTLEGDLRAEVEKMKEENRKSKMFMDHKTFEEEIKKITNSIIDYNDIEIQSKISEGTEGIVYSGYQKSTQRMVAVKQLIFQNIDYYSFSSLRQQIKIMTELNNFAILPFIGITINPICIVTEYMSNGSLFEKLHKTDPDASLSSTKRTIIALGIAYGLNYMHKKEPPLLHCDVKSLNVLLDSEDFPKLCDFGFSHYANEKVDLKPGGIGTPVWMAPEVIKGFEYTEKSDVYSYGIILWEILTGKEPFDGNMNNTRIMDEVAYNNRRLEIQRHDCPHELRSLISRCWAADPKNRPTFDRIIECFENGTVKFIGTQTDQVKAYISLFQSTYSNDDELFDFPIITDITIKNICSELDNEKDEGALKASSVLLKEKNHEFILQFKLIKSIVNAIDKCDSSRFANLLIKTVDIICKYKCLINEFEKEGGGPKFVKLFIKFGATSRKNIIQTLISFVSNVSNIVINYNAISKIAPFLLYNDLSCRLNSLKLLNLICDMKCYDSENSFNVIIRNVLINIFPKAKVELVIESLDFLLKLIKLSEFNLSILATEGIIKLTKMINNSNSEVSMKSMKIIIELLKSNIPNKNVVEAILSSVLQITKSKDEEKIKEILIILALSLKSKATLTKIQSNENKDLIQCFKEFLSSDNYEIVINALKLCFSFAFNSINQFIDLSNSYFQLLSNEKNEISILAASCLTLVYQKRPFKLTDKDNNKLVENFLKRELVQNSINIQIMNLCGVISTSLDGAIFFDKIDVLNLIINLIDNKKIDDSRISRIATMILASISALNPFCNHINEAFPIIFKMLNSNQNSPYPIIFIANMASTANGAFKCAKNMSDIIKNAELDLPRTIVAIERIMNDNKAKEIFFSENNGNINSLISLLLNKWNTGKTLLSIVEEISTCEQGRKAILDSKLNELLHKQFSEIDLLNESRPILLRILSRIRS